MKRLFNMNMLEGGFLVDHLNEFNNVTSQLSSIGVNFDYEAKHFLVLITRNLEWLSYDYQ